MAEPEELILEGAHFATGVVRDVWRRYGAPAAARTVPLTAVRARLELFLAALTGSPIVIGPIEPPAPASWLSRLAHGASNDRRDVTLRSGTDGRRLYLPPELPPSVCGLPAIATYRLLAVQQAVRLLRGTASVAAGLEQGETRDWFLLAEAAAADRWISLEVPGLAPALHAARAHALESGGAPAGSAFTRLVRAFLAGDDGQVSAALPAQASPERSLDWACARAAGSPARRSRRVALPWYWGDLLEPATVRHQPAPPAGAESRPAGRPRVAEMRRRPRVREAADDEDDAHAGTWVIRADEPQESVEDPFGLQRPADRDDDADPEGLADSLSELPEARLVSTPEPAREVLRSGDGVERLPGDARRAPRQGLVYPEWDHRLHAYRPRGAIVREPPVPLGPIAWVEAARTRHARLTRRVRARFERQRPRYVTFDRQTDGPEPDIAAWVDASADVRAGVAPDGRIYVDHRRARRELAVAVLADVSASTDSWVADTRRIVDIEKEALLVVCEALDALGDRYGIFAFSGEGADNVALLPVKGFDERPSPTIERRISGLDADGYTRVGAAVRHVTARLTREHAARRLLLVLSDGKPNDVDVYEGPYGVEDARQAAAEARRQGVSVFCLAVDREAPRYAGRIFGPGGFAVLRRTEDLPVVLVDLLRQLIRC